MKPDNSKPSLESLFKSKKYDLPNEHFWDEFQNQVKGKALASLSVPSLSRRCMRATAYSIPLIAVALLFLNNPISIDQSDISERTSSEVVPLVSEALNHSQKLAFIENLETEEIVASTEDSLLSLSSGDRNSFVEHSLVLEAEDTYEVQFLSNLEYPKDDLFARHTF